MLTTCPCVPLSSALRLAQRAFASWVDGGSSGGRRRAFAARAAIQTLDEVDRARLIRWLAWLCHASVSQGGHADPADRLRRLDARLYAEVARAAARLPAVASMLAPGWAREA